MSPGTPFPDKSVSSLFLLITLFNSHHFEHLNMFRPVVNGFTDARPQQTACCSIINGNILIIRDCTNNLPLFSELGSLLGLSCPVGLSCEEHTSGYKLWMFPVPITVNQQCMKQSHLPHRLHLFTHVCLYNRDSFWCVLIRYERGGCCISGEEAESVFWFKQISRSKITRL